MRGRNVHERWLPLLALPNALGTLRRFPEIIELIECGTLAQDNWALLISIGVLQHERGERGEQAHGSRTTACVSRKIVRHFSVFPLLFFLLYIC